MKTQDHGPVRAILVLVVILASVLSTTPATAADNTLREIGDVVQIALPLIGSGSSFFTSPDLDATRDCQGTRQFVRAYGSAWLTT